MHLQGIPEEYLGPIFTYPGADDIRGYHPQFTLFEDDICG